MGQMNYLAHLILSPPDDLSRLGNIMADFLRDVDREQLPPLVQAGIIHHHSIDKFTDSHEIVRDLRKLFSSQRRRFSGVVLDVVFDHILIKHWGRFSDLDFDQFVEDSYGALSRQHALMPERMQMVTAWMIKRDWVRSYRELTGIERALDGLASRLKMKHGFHGSIEEVEQHYAQIESGFLVFFPELKYYVESLLGDDGAKYLDQ